MGNGELLFNGYGVSFGMIKKFWKWIVGIVAQVVHVLNAAQHLKISKMVNVMLLYNKNFVCIYNDNNIICVYIYTELIYYTLLYITYIYNRYIVYYITI